MPYSLENFLNECREAVKEYSTAADYVEVITPLMHRLLAGNRDFLEEKHFQSNPDQYARNPIYIDPENRLSIYSLVWLPGQWTPIHDHGTWGVVGVVEGGLEERNFIRTDDQPRQATSGIELARGGSIILTPGSVTSFVPNPDHIHITGNGKEKRAVSLHLYGHSMAGFNIYNRDKGTKEWTEVEHS